MSDPQLDRPFPRGALIGAAALLGTSLLLAGAARITGVGTTSGPTSAPVESRLLRFEDRVDGSVAVYEAADVEPVQVLAPEAASVEPVQVLAPGTHGFVRSVLRGLARERKRQGVGREPAFRLTRWADGRLSLEDPTTGRSVELGAFGPTNRAAFAQLMTAGGGVR